MGDARAVLERISKSQNFDGYRQEHWHGSFDEYLDIVRTVGPDAHKVLAFPARFSGIDLTPAGEAPALDQRVAPGLGRPRRP